MLNKIFKKHIKFRTFSFFILIFIFFSIFPLKSKAYKRYYDCGETISGISGCTTKHSGSPEIAHSFVGKCECSGTTIGNEAWIDIEDWSSCCSTPDGCSTGWTVITSWSFTPVECCTDSDCGNECKKCDILNHQCVNKSNGQLCSVGVCYNGNCVDPDTNANACTSLHTVETCSGDWCYGNGNGVYDNGSSGWYWSSGTNKNCCGDDSGEVPRRSYYCTCSLGDILLGSQCIDNDGNDCGTPGCTYPCSGCYYGGDYLCCAPGECAMCSGCSDDDGPVPECTGGWWCDNGDWKYKPCTGINTYCSSGHCVCDSGWADCNNDGDCECDLNTNHCVSNSCVTSEIDCGLRAYDSNQIINIACEPAGTLTSPLRIYKNGTTYGIVLVDVSDVSASNIRIKTSAGIKALKKL